MTTRNTATPTAPAVDPTFARAEFFFDLELAELSLTVAQAAAPAPTSKY